MPLPSRPQGRHEPLGIPEQLQCRTHIPNHEVSRQDSGGGGPFFAQHGNTQSGLFEHQPVVAAVADSDGRLPAQLAHVIRFGRRLVSWGENHQPAIQPVERRGRFSKNAASALLSWKKPTTALTSTTPKMTPASTHSPRTTVVTPAAISTNTSG